MQHVRGEFLAVGIHAQRGDFARQAGSGDGGGHAFGIAIGDVTAARRIARRQHHAERHRLAVEQAVGKAGLSLERVAEGMAEIEHGARAGRLALVFGDDARLGLDAFGDGIFLGDPLTLQDFLPVAFTPLEERRIAEHAVLDDLGIAGAHLAWGQSGQRVEIGQHQSRLVEGADQVLARGGVDRRLAADGAVDLGEQGCRQLNEAATALEYRRRKAGEVADDSAAEREDVIAALDFLGEQPLGDMSEALPAFGPFAGIEHQPARLPPGGKQRRFHGFAPVPRHVGVGDDRHPLLAQQLAGLRGEVGQQAAADAHFVRAAGEIDGNYSHWSSSAIILVTVSPCGPLLLETWIGASA